mmetsp:Transcript_29780/g.71770  ORF Transcript_29780/g.71770 Transcript_29780/m.71770 type:complete len:1445 (+) Transcript_29780:115-4449(+)
MDDIGDLPDFSGSAMPSANGARSPVGASTSRPAGHPPAPAGGQGFTCPFAAISAVIDAGGLKDGNGSPPRTGSPLAAAVGSKKKMGSTLAPIGAGETDGGELPAFSHPQVLDAQGNLSLTCPMTGNAFNLSGATGGMSAIEALKNSAAAPAPAEPSDATAQLARQGSMAGSVARRAARRDNDGGSQAGSRASGSRVGSKMGGSRASKGTRNKSTAKTGSRKGGGGVMGGAVSRRERGAPKRKPPPWDDADVAKHAPVVKASWNRCLEVKGYFELGNLYYDTLFDEAPELSPMFTLERERMGVKFVDMLAAMVAVIDSPPGMHSKLESLAPMHIDRGVKATDMPLMGKVLFSVLTKALGAEFNESVQEAWGWVWAWLTKSMTLTLETAGGHNSLVLKSWDICMDNYTEEDLGGMLFDTLFELAPSLKSMFARPRPVMAMKFVEMVSTLVSFVDDESRMIEQINWLGSRHVKYGAKPHHIPIMGQVLLTVLEQSCGDEWTDEMANAWMDLWNASCARMMAAIKSGEQYGHVVESLWDKVQKKSSPTVLGSGLVRKLARTRSDLVRSFVVDRREWLEEKKVEIEEAMEKKAKADKAAKKTEKATSANSLVISTDAPPAPEYKARKKDGVLSSLKKALRKGASPTTELSSRHSLDEEEAHEVKDDKVDDSKKSVAGKGEDSKCRARRVQYSKVGEEEQVDAWGTEIYDMLHVVMDLLWEPEQMNERLIVIATRFYQWGLRLEHLEDLGEAIHVAIRVILECPCAECGNHEWDDEISGAWAWVWGIISTSMNKTIGALEKDHHKIVREMWEAAKAAKTSDEIGEALYTELGREAPFVLHLFQRPKKLQAYMWMQALEMIVVFSEVPEKFFEELRHLTIRHIKYGVKAEYIKPFGKAVLTGLEDLFGEAWNPVTEVAWKFLWQRVSTCVTRSLNVGTNLITVSLVNGDLDKLQDAITCAPRCERVSWVCRVEVYGSILSPIYWAIRDGKNDLAQFLISDALCLKADRDNYYYGRKELHDTHPEMLGILCRDSPGLVETLMDGLLWHSQTVEDGRLRANYYFKDIFSDPQQVPDAWKTPLAVMCQEGQPGMFGHPVVEKLLDFKWQRFGKTYFVGTQLYFAFLLCIFSAGFLDNPSDCTLAKTVLQAATGIIAVITLIIMLFLISKQVSQGHVMLCSVGRFEVPVPRLMTNFWQFFRLVSCMMIVANTAMGPCFDFLDQTLNEDKMRSKRILKSVTALLLFMQLFQALILSERLSALIYTVGVLFTEVWRNLFIVCMIMLSFGAALTALEMQNYDNVGTSVWNLAKMTLMVDTPGVDEMEPFGVVLIVAYIVISIIGMLSILIAQLNLAYETISKDKSGYAKMNRAYVCIEVESSLSMSYRNRIFNELGFDNPLDFDNGDQGPPGGVQVMEPASIRAHPKYCPDRIQRSTGSSLPTDPWPSMAGTTDEKEG